MREHFIAIGPIIIDDIILPDSTRKVGLLGGGLTHAAMGMRVWCDHVGIFSGVGKDFEQKLTTSLSRNFDVHGLFIHDELPTPRAWQEFDNAGTRNEIFQTNLEAIKEFVPHPHELLDKPDQISGAYLYCPSEDVSLWVSILRQKNCQMILWEPWGTFCVPENLNLFRKNCELVDIVSPNLEEARQLLGLNDPQEIILRLRNMGAQIAVLRMGEAGSLIIGEKRKQTHITAYPVKQVVDVTGAGNAYCGGFVVGLFRTGAAEEAGWHGAVSASFALEQFGALYDLKNTHLRAMSRLAWYKNLL